MLSVRLFSSGILSALLFTAVTAHAVTIPPNDGFVTDEAGVLSEEEESLLETDLAAYRSTTTNEIAVVVLPSLDGDVIADAAVEIGRSWGVGSEKDNGILILIDYEGREVFLATGYGLEGAVPDIVAKGIVEKDMIPAFREGEYGEGITAAVASLKKHIAGEYTADRYEERESDDGFFPFAAFFFFILLQWMFAILARTKSWWLGGVFGGIGGILLIAFFGWWLALPILIPLGLLLDYLISKNFSARSKTKWWAGGGWGPGGFGGGMGGGRSGGGFGGFGGGSFGGGGAGGKW